MRSLPRAHCSISARPSQRMGSEGAQCGGDTEVGVCHFRPHPQQASLRQCGQHVSTPHKSLRGCRRVVNRPDAAPEQPCSCWRSASHVPYAAPALQR
eukprot:scaffold652_cov68-Phaeocystis_antarctica.AAC.2